MMTGLNIYFVSFKKLPLTSKRNIWSTPGLKLETYFEYTMKNILLDLEQENIWLRKKFLSIFATNNPAYLLLIKIG